MIPVLVNVSTDYVEFGPKSTQMFQSFRVRLDWSGFGWQLVLDQTGDLLEPSPREKWSRLPIPVGKQKIALGVYQALMDDYVVLIGEVMNLLIVSAEEIVKNQVENTLELAYSS